MKAQVMPTYRRWWMVAVAVASFWLSTSQAAPAAVIVNGGFEAGLAGWTVVNQVGSDGSFFAQTGTSSPVNGFPVPAPPEGSSAAMTDSEGPGSHVLYQDFIVPLSPGSVQLSFLLFINNHADDFYAPGNLDFATPELNQQVRVDILQAGSDPFSTSPSDVLLNVYQTLPGDPLESGYSLIVTDVSSLFAANPGQTLRLRFSEVSNVLFFQLGVDDVSLSTASAVPEPSSLGLMGMGSLLGFVGYTLRRTRSRPSRFSKGR
jgi:hypothetical protein